MNLTKLSQVAKLNTVYIYILNSMCNGWLKSSMDNLPFPYLTQSVMCEVVKIVD